MWLIRSRAERQQRQLVFPNTQETCSWPLSRTRHPDSEPLKRRQQLGGDQFDHGERVLLSHVRPEEAERHVRRAQRVEPPELLETFVGRADHERIVHETLDAVGEASSDAGQTMLCVGAVLGRHGGPRPRARLFARGRDVELAVHGNLRGYRMPALSEGRAPHAECLPQLLERERADRVEGMAQAPGAADGGLGHARYPDARIRPLVWPRGWPGAGDPVEATVMRALVGRPQALHQGQTFLEPRHTLGHRRAGCFELLPPIAQADAENQPSAADVIERGDVLSDLNRIQQRREEHAGHQVHVAGLGGEAGEYRDRLEVLEGMDQPVMAPRHEIEAGITARTKVLELLEPLPLQIVAGGDDLPYLR